MDGLNQIKIVLRNMSDDITLQNIYYTIECFDLARTPMVCNTDGVSTYFTGSYPLELAPNEWTQHGRFIFDNYVETGYIGYFTVTVTGYEFDTNQKWNIPEEDQVAARSNDSSHIGEPTPTPIPTFGPDATPAPDLESSSGNG